MEGKVPSISRLILGVVLFAAVAGGASYIRHLRAENARLGRPERAAAAAAAPSAARSLSPAQHAAMLATLRSADKDAERLVWFATTPNNPEAAAFQRAIQAVFEEAGWQVRGNVQVTFPIKPGIFLFMADEEPPADVLRASEAFEAAGISTAGGRGYRTFYHDRKQGDPNWRGFDMAPDQTFVVVIGRRPEE